MTGRPQPNEAATYYFTYIDQVTGDDAVAVMQQQLAETQMLFAAISEKASLHRYAPEKWSIREVLNHLTDTERAFAFRALWFARGFDAPLPGYDQNIAAAGAAADKMSWAAHVEEFQQVRLSTISLFRNLPPEAWMRSGIASDNRFTVRAMAFIIAGHVAHHVAILRERYAGAMAMKKKPAEEGFLTVAAQTIGSTLGQLAKKAGVVSAPPPAKKKAAAKKPAPIAKKKAVAKKKAPARKSPVKKAK